MFDCNYFWRAVSIWNDGSLRPCCHYDAFRDKSIDNRTLEDDNIQNQQSLQQTRQTVLDGNIPTGCNICETLEKNGVSRSPRKRGYNNSKEYLKTYQAPTDKEKQVLVERNNIEHMNIDLGNTCNYMCVICNPGASHLIAKEQGRKDLSNSSWGDNEEKILSFIRKAENLTSVAIAGGEPFYNINMLNKVLEALILVKDKCRLHITTNGSKVTNETANLIKQFRRVQISISIDGTGRYNDFQRWNSNWKDIEKNITNFKEVFGEDVDIELNATISAITLPDLPKLIKWADDNPAIDWMHPSFLVWPDHLQCSILKPEVLQSVSNEIKQIDESVIKRIMGQQGLTYITDYLENAKSTSVYRKEFDKHFSSLKELRQNFDVYKAFPELQNNLM